MLNIAIMGFGVVGSGVFEVLSRSAEVLRRSLGQVIAVKKVLDLRSFPGDPVQDVLTHDADDILNDPDISVVIEVMGGINPAYEYSMRALCAGKHVITSNKELVAVHGPALMAAAKAHGARYLFEASVGGGMPIVRPLKQMLMSEDVYQIDGILNGTTNYILSQMELLGLDFDEALKQAQEQGYAERDPSSDLDGFDASRKLAILLSLCVGKHINYSKLYTEGISGITREDFAAAQAIDSTIKLMARASIRNGEISALVAPMLVPAHESLFAGVKDNYNAAAVTGSISDTVMFYGQGAGKYATSGAVLSDIAVALSGLPEIGRWDPDEAVPASPDNYVDEWAMRISYKYGKPVADINDVFGEVTWIDLPSMAGQSVVIAPPMRQADFKADLALLKDSVTVENALRVYAGR